MFLRSNSKAVVKSSKHVVQLNNMRCTMLKGKSRDD